MVNSKQSETQRFNHTRSKTSNKKVHWSQYAMIAMVLLFLTLQALPNFYGFHYQVVVNSTKPTTALPDIKQLQSALQRADIIIDTARHNVINDARNVVLSIADEAQATRAKEVLLEKWPNGLNIAVDETRDLPTWLQTIGAQPVKLGLDLSGGVLFVLEVDHQQALDEMIDSQVVLLKQQLVANKLRGVSVIKLANQQIKLTERGNQQKLSGFVQKQLNNQQPFSIVDKASNHIVIGLQESQKKAFRRENMAQTIKTMRGRIEELGITEAVTQQQGQNRVRIELPGVKDPQEAKRIIGATASLDFYQFATDNSQAVKTMRAIDGQTLRLDATPIFSGSSIEHAMNGRDEYGKPLVNLRLDSIGGRKMAVFSKENVGNPMVTVYTEYVKDEHNQTKKTSKVINIARISQQLSANFSITNMESTAAAHELALLLRAGSLSAPVTVIQQRTIHATLGEDNITHGLMALAVGLSCTFLFMALWYRELGIIANSTLMLNLLCLLGLMSLLPGAVLTLPGIAGLVLTVGMAVDTNVLIFERIKEELKKERSVAGAISAGYQNAFSAILDANLTTMITALILYAIGYGPVKGFALTLSLGILTSLFTGVFVAKIATITTINPKRKRLLGVSS